jgi:hypothetical protein
MKFAIFFRRFRTLGSILSTVRLILILPYYQHRSISVVSFFFFLFPPGGLPPKILYITQSSPNKSLILIASLPLHHICICVSRSSRSSTSHSAGLIDPTIATSISSTVMLRPVRHQARPHSPFILHEYTTPSQPSSVHHTNRQSFL